MLWNPNIEKASSLYFSHNTWEHVDRVNVRSDRNKISKFVRNCVSIDPCFWLNFLAPPTHHFYASIQGSCMMDTLHSPTES